MVIKLEENLATRESARVLFNKLKENNDFELDFTNVLIASRSFANELLKLEKENNIAVKKLNLNDEVKFMFDTADKILDNDILSRNKYSVISLKKYASLI